MEGTLSVSKTDHYKYKIVVALSEGRWTGYTLLDQGGPNETKSSVTVQFAKERQGLIFAEKSLISTKSKETTFCFVGGFLKMNDKKTTAKGFFLGHDGKNKPCGNGSVKLNLPEAAQVQMTPDGTKDTNAADVVTSFKSQSYRVNSQLITLELWDGGVNDHDSLSVSLNGVEILPGFEIVNEKKRVQITLKKGENIIKIKALNEGSQPPNSARIMIADQANQYPLVSFLRKDEEATMKIKW